MFFSRTLSFTLGALLVCLSLVAQANVENTNPLPETKVMICPLPVFDDIAIGVPEILDSTIRISSSEASIEQDQTALFNGSFTFSYTHMTLPTNSKVETWGE